MVLDGATPIRDLETQYKLALPSEGYETLAGFLLTQFQRIPRDGESVEFQNHRFTVVEMDGRRVAKVLVENLAPNKATGEPKS